MVEEAFEGILRDSQDVMGIGGNKNRWKPYNKQLSWQMAGAYVISHHPGSGPMSGRLSHRSLWAFSEPLADWL